MHCQSRLSLGFGLISLATAQFSINRNEAQTVVQEINDFIATATRNPSLQTVDIPALEQIAPISAILAAETDPATFIEDLVAAAATNTALIAAVPTPVLDSLRTILAKPLKAVADISAYLTQLLDEPGVTQTLQELEQVVPADVQQQVESQPVAFLENLVTATTVPAWVTLLPAPVQVELASVLNKGLSIVDADFRASATGVATGTGLPVVGASQSGAPYPVTTGAASGPVATGTGGVGPTGSGKGAQPSSVPFLGGAERVSVGAAVLVGAVGAGVLVWL